MKTFSISNLITGLTLSSLSVLLSGCSSTFDPAVKASQDEAADRSAQAQNLLRQPQNEVPLVTEEKTLRFTQKSIPFSRSTMLPTKIGNVTLRVPGRHNLSTVADLISNATNIPVVMTPDALMDVSLFAPGRGAALGGAPIPAGGNDEASVYASLMAAGAARLALNDQLAQNTMELNYSGTLSGLLNLVSAKARLRWTYEDDRIVFRRVITRTIMVKTLPGSIKSTGSLSLTSGGASGGSQSATTDSDTDFWQALDKTIPLLISSQGQAIVDQRMGIVTVRDSIDNVQAVEKLVDFQNSLFLRQISLNVEVLQVDLSLEHQSGIDWNYVSDSLAKSNTVLTLTGAPVLAGTTTPGTFGFKFNNASGGLNGQVLFKVLEKFGRVSTAYSSVLTTVNRQSVPVGVLNTLSYLKSITPATTQSTTGGSSLSSGVGLVPGEITTGFSLNLLPMVLDSNRVLLQCTISISSLRELTKFSSGSGDAAQSVQQPNIDTFASLQRMTLNSGETMVMMGFERDEARTNQTDVVRNSLPGSRLITSNKKSTIILVTPRLLGV
jgi:type IVB pilus formation R64 PilN family outer membrane protein